MTFFIAVDNHEIFTLKVGKLNIWKSKLQKQIGFVVGGYLNMFSHNLEKDIKT